MRRLLVSVAVAVAGTVVAVALGGRGAGSIALFFAAILALASNAARFVEVARRRLLHTGAAVAHLGFALMFVGIVAGEAWDQKVDLRLPRGESAAAFGRTITYTGYVEGSDPKDEWGLKVHEAGRRDRRCAPHDVHPGQRAELQEAGDPAPRRRRPVHLADLARHRRRSQEASAISLKKEEPLSYGGATLTLLGYQMGGGMGEGA